MGKKCQDLIQERQLFYLFLTVGFHALLFVDLPTKLNKTQVPGAETISI